MASDENTLLGWVINANISDHIRGGPDPDKFYQGTRKFSPGTKMFLGGAYWGVGGMNVHVTGLRRVSKRLVNCVVHIGVLQNFRVKSVYSPKLVFDLDTKEGIVFLDKHEAEEHLARLEVASGVDMPSKLKPEIVWGPWGDWQREKYRTDND